MSSPADGSIVVDTELNTKGFEANSAELKKAVQSLSTQLESLGPTLQKVFSGNASAMTSFTAKATQMEDQIKAIQSQMESLGKSRVPTQQYQALVDSANKAGIELEKLQKKQKRLEGLKVDKNSKQWKNLQYDIAQAGKKLESYNAHAKELESSGKAFQLGTDTEEYKTLSAQLDALKIKYADLQAEAAKAAPAGKLANEMKSTSSEVDKLVKKYNDLNAKGVDKTAPQWKALQNEIAAAAGKVEAYKARIAELQAQGVDTSAMQESLSGMEAQINAMQDAKSKSEALKSSFSKLGSVIASIGKKAASAFGTMIKYIGGGRASLAKFNRNGKDTNKTIGKLRKSMTGFMGLLKRLALRKLISGIFSSAQEGIQNLAKYSSSFNSDMSELLTLFNQLKNTLATVFAPILSIAMPILTTLIEAFQSAAEKAAEFFAALSGSSTFTKAIKKYKDYAESLQNSVTASFDQLNTLSDSDEDDASTLFETADVSSSVASFIAQLKEAFANGDLSFLGEILAEKLNGFLSSAKEFLSDTSSIQTGIEAIVSALNSLVNGIDWELAGNVIGSFATAIIDSLHTLYSSIDWAGLGTALANGLNGIIESVDWSSFGSLFVEKFMAIITFLHTAVETFDWDALGAALADAVNGVFEAIDWEEIWTFISDTITGLVNGIISLIQNIDWGQVSESVSDLLIGFVDACVALVQDIDWAELLISIGNALNDLFSNIDWGALTSSLSELLGSLLALIVQLFWEGIKSSWQDWLDAFTSITDYFGDAIEECGGNVALGILKGIADVFVNIGTWIYDHIFKPFIDGFKSLFGINSPSTVMAEMGGYLVQGLLNGIKNLWSTITDFFSNALESIKSLFTNAWNSIKEGATTAWTNIKSALSTAWNGIKSTASNVCDGLKSTISNAWNSIKTTTSTVWTNIKSTLSTTWDGIKSTASSVWSNLKSTISNAWSSVKSTTTSIWSSISSSLSSTWSNLKSSATTWGKDLVNNLADGITSAVSTVKNAVSTVADKIKSWLGFSEPEEGPLSNFHTFMPDMLDLMAKGIEGNADKPLDAVADIAQAISDEFDNDEYALGTIGVTSALDESLETFADKIENHFDSLIERLQAIANGIVFSVPVAASAAIPHGSTDGRNGNSGAGFARLTALMETIAEKLDGLSNGLDGAKQAVVDAIDEKETGITSDAIYTSVKQSAKKETKATGRNPFGG